MTRQHRAAGSVLQRMTRRDLCANLAVALVLASQPSVTLAQSNAGPAPGTAAPSPSPRTMVGPGPVSAFPQGDFDLGAMRSSQLAATEVYAQTVKFARCVERTHPEKLQRLLEKAISSRAESFAAQAMLHREHECLAPDSPVGPRLLRGAAAEAMLENLATPDPDVARVANTDRVKKFHLAMPKVDGVRDTTSADVQKVIECQVVLAPGLSRKLVDAVPGSLESDRLRHRIAEATGRCGEIVAVGLTYEIVYRTYLAEALYHWTRVGIGNRFS